MKTREADHTKAILYGDVPDALRALASHINLVADTILEYA